MEIVKLDHSEYGLKDSTASAIKAQFKPMLDKMEELEGEYNEVLELDLEDPETATRAKALRLKYVKVRTGTAEIHKKQKEFYLKGGRFVDGWKNAQLMASNGKEEALMNIEKHQENLEKERLAKLKAKREEEISPYVDEMTGISLELMEEDVFQAFLSAKKKQHEDKLAAEKKAREEREAREKKEAEERERQRKENVRLKREAAKREKRFEELQPFSRFMDSTEWADIPSLSEAKYKDKLAELQKISDEVNAKEEKEKKDRQRKEREKSEALEKERKAREEAEAKIREKEKAEAEEEERKRKEAEELAKAPIKEQLKTWVMSSELSEIPEDLAAHDTAIEITQAFNDFQDWAINRIDKL